MKAVGEKIRVDADGAVDFDIDIAAKVVADLKLADEFHLIFDAKDLAYELEQNGGDLERAAEVLILEYGQDETRFSNALRVLLLVQSQQNKSGSAGPTNKRQDKKTKAIQDPKFIPGELSKPNIKEHPNRPDTDAEKVKRERYEKRSQELRLALGRLAQIESGVIVLNTFNWQFSAKCKESDPEIFFVESPDYGEDPAQDAKNVCIACTVKNECMMSALENEDEFGVWGGLDEGQLEAIRLKKFAEAQSDAVVLEHLAEAEQ